MKILNLALVGAVIVCAGQSAHAEDMRQFNQAAAVAQKTADIKNVDKVDVGDGILTSSSLEAALQNHYGTDVSDVTLRFPLMSRGGRFVVGQLFNDFGSYFMKTSFVVHKDGQHRVECNLSYDPADRDKDAFYVYSCESHDRKVDSFYLSRPELLGVRKPQKPTL